MPTPCASGSPHLRAPPDNCHLRRLTPGADSARFPAFFDPSPHFPSTFCGFAFETRTGARCAAGRVMHSRGFTLLEVVIALSILCVAVLTIAQLLGLSAEGMAVSRAQTMTTTLASARLEQLRTLTLACDDAGGRITD